MIRFRFVTMKRLAKKFKIATIFLSAVFVALPLFGQEQKLVQVDHFSEGILLEIAVADISSGNPLLAIQDSGNGALALIKAELDSEQLWVGNAATPPALPNSIHWQVDEQQGVLTLDISRVDLANARTLKLWVSPVGTHQNRLSLSIYSLAAAADANDLSPQSKTQEILVEKK